MSEKTSRLNGYLRYMEVLEKTSSKAVATKAVASDTISVTVAVSCYQTINLLPLKISLLCSA